MAAGVRADSTDAYTMGTSARVTLRELHVRIEFLAAGQ